MNKNCKKGEINMGTKNEKVQEVQNDLKELDEDRLHDIAGGAIMKNPLPDSSSDKWFIFDENDLNKDGEFAPTKSEAKIKAKIMGVSTKIKDPIEYYDTFSDGILEILDNLEKYS